MGRQVRQTLRVPSVRGLCPAVGALLLVAGSVSTGMAQGYTYAGTSNNTDPYAYLSDLAGQSSSGVIVNPGAMGESGLLMPNGTYPRSYGPTMIIGGGSMVDSSPVDSMGNPVSRSYLPSGGRTSGAPMAALPPSAPAPRAPEARVTATRAPAPSRPAPVPVERTESRPAPMRAAVAEPTRITVPDPEPAQREPQRVPTPPARTAVIEPPPPSPVPKATPAKPKPVVEEVRVVETPKAAPPVRLSSGQGPIRLSAGIGPIRAPDDVPATAAPAAPPPTAVSINPVPAKPKVAKAEPAVIPPVKQAPVKTEPAKSQPAPTPPLQTATASPPSTPTPKAPTKPVATTPPPAPPVTKAPPAAPAPQAASQAKPEAQVAARTAPVVQTDGTLSLSFAAGAPDLPPGSEDTLNRIAKAVSKDTGQRVRILSYANATDGNTNQAKRLSLTRALNVRAYLMDQGISSPNIEVRAMGNQDAGTNPDRVDISVTP